MSTRTSSLAILPPPGTLAWVLHELPKLEELSAQARQNMSSSIRRLCHVLERPPDRVRADLKALDDIVRARITRRPAPVTGSPAQYQKRRSPRSQTHRRGPACPQH